MTDEALTRGRRALADALENAAAAGDDAALGQMVRAYIPTLVGILRLDPYAERRLSVAAERARLLKVFAEAPKGLTYDDLWPHKPDWDVVRALWATKLLRGNSADIGRTTRFVMTDAGRAEAERAVAAIEDEMEKLGGGGAA